MQFLNFKKQLVSFSIVGFLFSGCVGGMSPIHNNQEVATQMPSWYIQPPENNLNTLYGIGTGDTLEEAKTNALNAMASRLIVSVQSAIKTTTIVSKGIQNSYNKNIKKDITVAVQQIKFTNAKIVKSIKVGDTIYLLMSVDRIKLFNTKQKEFLLVDKLIDDKVNQSLNYTKLEQISILQDAIIFIEQNKKRAIVLNAIKPSFNYDSYFLKYNDYINKLNLLKNNLKIAVVTNNNGEFKNVVLELLNQNHYKVSNSISNSDVQIKLDNNIRYSTARGWYIVRVATTIKVVSNNKVLSSRIVSVIGRSSSSKENALAKAASNFKDEINQLTLEKIIFSK